MTDGSVEVTPAGLVFTILLPPQEPEPSPRERALRVLLREAMVHDGLTQTRALRWLREEAMRAAEGNKSAAARLLGITRRTLYRPGYSPSPRGVGALPCPDCEERKKVGSTGTERDDPGSRTLSNSGSLGDDGQPSAGRRP